jgi:hypothetical protein
LTFALARSAGGSFDGGLDNVYVDLPAGFVGDPNAVPKCSAEQFSTKPTQCPPETQVGVLHLVLTSSVDGNFGGARGGDLEIVPVFNLQPRVGNLAELGIANLGDVNATSVRIVADARTNGDFGVTTFVGQIPAALPLFAQAITVWGVPWDPVHDRWRAPQGHTRSTPPCSIQRFHGTGSHIKNVIPPVGFTEPTPVGFTAPGCAQSYESSWGRVRPFLSNLTECAPSDPVTGLAIDSYQDQGAFGPDGDPDYGDPDWKRYRSPAPAVTGCERLPFDPAASFVPTAGGVGAPTGLVADVEVAQNRDLPFDPPAGGASQGEIDAYLDAAVDHWRDDGTRPGDSGRGLAASHLDKTVVTLPEGLSVNPSAATGLVGCSDAQMGVTAVGNPYRFNNADPFDGAGLVECPGGSKIGTVEATTPLLEEPLTGEFVLGTPKSTDPASGEMLRTFIVVRDRDRGLVAKVFGSTVADPATGRLTATFDKNPRVPVENIQVRLKGGSRGVLANPSTCGTKTTSAVFTPWTAAHGGGGRPATALSQFGVGGDCSNPFAPDLDEASMSTRDPRAHGEFSFRFSRSDGQRWLSGLTARLPEGLLASVKGLVGDGLCSNAQAAAGACPAASRIGTVDARAGAGDPFVLEQKGEVFLTEGYKGGAYGLAVKVRAIAGPFRGALELSPVLVRQAIHVDRKTARVTAISDPFPLIHHGVPLRVREVTVLVDRERFMLNPSGCSPRQVGADLSSDTGQTAGVSSPFRAAGCAKLPFRPRLALRLAGRRQMRTGRHPAIRALVRQKGVGEAGVDRAQVRLPRSLALDPDNAQALCEFDQGTKPDLENHCPKGSIVGRARATSPLLNRPLAGPVFFVKNIRTDPRTGNTIRTLPTIVAALRGEIAINLRGTSNVDRKSRLVNTFKVVPDAPVNRFNLNIKGGRNGIIAVTRTRRGPINLCRSRRQTAITRFKAHNNRRHNPRTKLKTACRKKTTAKRRRANRNRSRRAQTVGSKTSSLL